MTLEWSTGSLPRKDRFAYWREVICEAFVPLTPHARERSSFYGNIRSRQIGGCTVVDLSSDAHYVTRGRAEIGRSANDYYLVNLLYGGAGHMNQFGRSAHMRSGDISLVDTTQPFEIRFTEKFALTNFRIPRHMLRPHLTEPARAPATLITPSKGMGGLLKSYLQEFARLQDDVPAGQAAKLDETLCSLLSLALEPAQAQRNIGGQGRNELRYLAVTNYARQRLSDPDLTPAKVAAACGMSVRYLHKIFEPRGQSFGQWVLAERLEECRRQLADQRFAHKNISVIAYDWGFNNLSHFGRVFRSEFGLSPRAYRQQVLSAGHLVSPPPPARSAGQPFDA